jgi:hypothetical protein
MPRNGRAVGRAVVGQQAVEDDEGAGRHFQRNCRTLIGPGAAVENFHRRADANTTRYGTPRINCLSFFLRLRRTAHKALAQRPVVPTRRHPQAAVLQGGVFQRKPEGGYGDGRGVKKRRVLVPAHFAANAGLFEDVLRLPDLGLTQTQVCRKLGQGRAA